MTLWTIGFLFTLGYLGYFDINVGAWKRLGFLLETLTIWPVLLGMEISEQFKEKNNKKDKKNY